jgi:peptidoglycan/xylan/chitin deacetylase (PgdA/CDA1 family)
MKKNGLFIISLDFELHWGVFDALSLDEYEKNLKAVPSVINRLLELGEKYNINYTFATVGLLFNQNKNQLLESLPDIKPKYLENKFNSYNLIPILGNSEIEDPIHYAKSLIDLIATYPNHEIASHTFSHYYCREKGQDVEAFEADLIAFKNIAQLNNVNLKSIVFPKNQVNNEYLDICSAYGINTYRGTEKSSLYQSRPQEKTNLLIRFLRLLDTYVNISGQNIYTIESLYNQKNINLPSSRFLRPYNSKLSFFEHYKISRITKAMKLAAKTNSIYHLWWHPHNFGDNIEENFKNLEKIFIAYKKLNMEYNFESNTMQNASDKVKNQ